MNERNQIVQDTVDQLIEQALRQMAEKGYTGDAEEEMSRISDQIRQDPQLEPLHREQMLAYIAQLNCVAQRQRRYLYCQGAKDCVCLLRELGVIR